MVEQVSITPNRIVTTRNSSAITFDTDNRYFKTTNNGNLKTQRLMNSPQVTTSSSGVNVSSGGVLLAMLHFKDMKDGALIRIPDTLATGLILKITFGYRAGWFPTRTPRSAISYSTSIIVTAYDANGEAKNFVVADNLKRNTDFITTPFNYGLGNTYDYQGRWTYEAANTQVLSLEVTNVVPGGVIQVLPLRALGGAPSGFPNYDMIPLCFYIRQADKVETGIGISP